MDLQFSDEPLNLDQDFQEWEPAPEFAPPPQAGTYKVYVDQIREESEFQVEGVGLRYKATLDLRIVGGEYDNRLLTFQRFSNKEMQRRGSGKRTSQLLDLVKSAGLAQAPRSNADFSKVLHRMREMGPAATFPIATDWRGFCTPCYERKIMELTGKPTVQEAKDSAASSQRNEAATYATKAKTSRSFPTGTGAGLRKDSFTCPDCKNEVRAQVQVQRFLAPTV